MTEPTIDTIYELRDVLSRITFRNTVLDFKWAFESQEVQSYNVVEADREVAGRRDGLGPCRRGWLVWVTFERPDTITGKVGRGRGRDEIIWAGATVSAAVKTAWVLVKMIVEHELMEGYCFDGKRIFNPHNSVFDLAALQAQHDAKRGIPSIG